MPHHEPIRKRSGGTGPGAGNPGEIPDKLYFRIGEVAKLCEVPAYVLRFWEGEFPQFKPNKGGTGQRLFRRRDVEMALRIKTLLYDEGYTIPGARLALKSEPRSAPREASDPHAPGLASSAASSPGQAVDARLVALRKDLEDLHTLLLNPAAMPPARSPVRSIRPSAPPRPLTPPTPFPRPTLTLTLERKPDPDLFSALDPD